MFSLIIFLKMISLGIAINLFLNFLTTCFVQKCFIVKKPCLKNRLFFKFPKKIINLDSGSYCTLGSKSRSSTVACAVNADDVPGVTCAVECPLGAFCETGSYTPNPCAEGTFTRNTGRLTKFQFNYFL